MTPLVIDDQAISDLKKFAEDNPINVAESTKIIAGEAPPPGKTAGYSILLPPVWRLVFTVSEYNNKDKSDTVWVRHMSMSLGKPGKLPAPATLEMIAKQLGFPPLDQCQVEQIGNQIEVLCPVSKCPTE